VVNPSKEIKPHFRCFSVTLASGKVLTGTLMFRDDRQLMLCERAADGQLVMRTVPLADVEYEEGQPLIVPLTQSLMPAGFEELLTPRELDAVVTLIYQLN
jgi:hypothetical protein